MFFKILKYDLVTELRRSYIKYIVSAVFGCCLSVYAIHTLSAGGTANLSVGDIVFFIFAGKGKYVPSPANIFSVPADWLMLMLFICWFTLYYPYHELTNTGKNILILSRSRSAWWFSKCSWCVICVLTYYSVIFLSVFALSAIYGLRLNMEVSPSTIFLKVPDISYTSDFGISCTSVVMNKELFLAVAVSICVCINQLLLSLIIRPSYSFLVSIVVYVSSVYFLSPYLLGNYAMLARSAEFIENGVHFTSGIVLVSVLSVASAIIGCRIFLHYDIIVKG